MSSVGAGKAPVAAGFTVSVAVRVTPPATAVMVIALGAVTVVVEVVNVAVVAPPATVTFAGTEAAVFELVRDTTSPPAGAALDKVTVPVDEAPPTTLAGARATADSVGAAGVVAGVNRLVDENGPNAPAAFRARTRHQSCWPGSALIDACDTVTIWLATNGDEIVELLSTWIS